MRRRRELVRGTMRDHARTCVSAGAAAVPPERGGARRVQPGRGGCGHGSAERRRAEPSRAEARRAEPPSRCAVPGVAGRQVPARPGEPRQAPARGPSRHPRRGGEGGAAGREEGPLEAGAACPDSPGLRPGPARPFPAPHGFP